MLANTDPITSVQVLTVLCGGLKRKMLGLIEFYSYQKATASEEQGALRFKVVHTRKSKIEELHCL